MIWITHPSCCSFDDGLDPVLRKNISDVTYGYFQSVILLTALETIGAAGGKNIHYTWFPIFDETIKP